MRRISTWYVAAVGAFALLAGSLVVGGGVAEAHAPSSITVNAIGNLGFTTFPQTPSVTGTVSHSDPGGVNSVNIQLRVNGSNHGAEVEIDIAGNPASGSFSAPWQITSPGTYTIDVRARHGQDDIVSTSQQVVVTHLGTIIVEKVSVNEIGSFDFGGDLGSFEITTTAVDTAVAADPFERAAATYVVSETVPDNWTLLVTCHSSGPSTTFDYLNAGVGIALAAGETVTCTFTNTYTAPSSGDEHPGCKGILNALDRVQSNPGAAKSQGKSVATLEDVKAKHNC